MLLPEHLSVMAAAMPPPLQGRLCGLHSTQKSLPLRGDVYKRQDQMNILVDMLYDYKYGKKNKSPS